ncbi:MAG: hypothetical protein QNK92_11355 [Amylibacter sp.]
MLLAPIHMIRDIRARGGFLAVWGPVLNFPQIIGRLIFITTLAGALVLILNLATLLIAGNIHKRAPFSRLTSLCHVLWLPLVPYLITVWNAADKISFFGLWLAFVTATMILCLRLDGVNLWKYYKGASTEL